ncbi:hypothetical protein RND71_003205 [Anisodus tanguticus]|uniref:Neprosin PEP catalytic domain-containing protein n=1 Tax=Anisodus tanguticus TaxID=243964 RepID=A0AAE1SW08_9SOLA|nr:hypothetical protein RND71_003205 [Anisodus tanguticus]
MKRSLHDDEAIEKICCCQIKSKPETKQIKNKKKGRKNGEEDEVGDDGGDDKLRPGDELHNMKMIKSHLMKINKPSLKTIQSPDGDLIDCVLSHQQPAFDHHQLKGQKPLEPPDRPRSRHNSNSMEFENFQLWSFSGETCPEGTIPVRRTKEQDILRASSIRKFGRKIRRPVRRDTTSNGHEVSPELYGDNYPRFFTYWTSDAYQATGCYNLLCSGFVQTNNRIAIGAAISPTSSYSGGQYDISIMIWKDPKHGHWWLEFGSGVLVGYWPSFLFTHLRGSASMIQFGGEIVNSRSNGFHTSTQMGNGHFAGEGFGKASYFRNLQVVDWDNSLIPLSNLKCPMQPSLSYNTMIVASKQVLSLFLYIHNSQSSRMPTKLGSVQLLCEAFNIPVHSGTSSSKGRLTVEIVIERKDGNSVNHLEDSPNVHLIGVEQFGASLPYCSARKRLGATHMERPLLLVGQRRTR